LQAAHIFGVERAPADEREKAGVLSSYDTSGNGMLLKKSLHAALHAYLWCMDQFLVVHVSKKGKKKQDLVAGSGWGEVKLSVDEFSYPSRKLLLRTRFELYKKKKSEYYTIFSAGQNFGTDNNLIRELSCRPSRVVPEANIDG
jgi:hypothetical protein